MDGPPELERLVAEQRGYYRAIAADYEDYAIPGAWGMRSRRRLNRGQT